MSDIKLNFINKSNDINTASVVIFQKNVATDFDALTVPWKVLTNCHKNEKHPLTYSQKTQLVCSDSSGNKTTKLDADKGQQFEVTQHNTTTSLQLASIKNTTTSEEGIVVTNHLSKGAIHAQLLRNGRLVGFRNSIRPHQKAVFKFQPKLYIAAISGIEEGSVINSPTLEGISTELPLEGITSADIVMMGGGTGATATPFNFSMENVVKKTPAQLETNP